MSHGIEKSGDFTTQWIFAQYEMGRPVSEIAAEMNVCESAVYARMRVKPETYDQVKKVREEQYCRRLRRVRGLADSIALNYLERLYQKMQTAQSDEEKAELDSKIDDVLKIARLYADRVQLAEGKVTAGDANGLPFRIVVTKRYEQAAVSGRILQENTDDTE